MITCDGSFGEIPRENYIMAEEKTVSQLKQLGKPFVIVLNSSEPSSHRTAEMAKKMEAKYSAPVIAANCATMDKSVPEKIFDQLLSQFPVSEIFIDLPEYMDALPQDHEVKAGLVDTMLTFMKTVDTVSSVESSLQVITANENVKTVEILRCEMATGRVFASVKLKDGLYYQIIGELLRHPVNNDRELFLLMREYARAKQAYDDMKEALDSVTRSGYGIVHPKLQQMKLGEPEVFKQGSKYGVRLVASAPCLHIIRTDISTEISPIVGSEQQSADLVNYLMEKFSVSGDEMEIWETNLFGKSLQEMVVEQMDGKLTSMPESLQGKVQRSLQKISNEGKDYFICIIL